MLSVSYGYYSTEYFGDKLTDSEFPKYLKRARLEVNTYTFNKVNGFSDSEIETQVYNEIRDCLCEVAEKIKSVEKTDGKEISSESLGSHSVSYSSKSSDKTVNQSISALVDKHLGLYGLTSFPQW